MLNGLDKLPTARAEYYKRLHDRLVEINFHAVNKGDWRRVIDAANMSLRLQSLAVTEAASSPTISHNAIEIALSIIQDYCRSVGWC